MNEIYMRILIVAISQYMVCIQVVVRAYHPPPVGFHLMLSSFDGLFRLVLKLKWPTKHIFHMSITNAFSRLMKIATQLKMSVSCTSQK